MKRNWHRNWMIFSLCLSALLATTVAAIATEEPKTPAQTPPSAEPAAPVIPPKPPEPTQTPIEGLEKVQTPSGLVYYDIKKGTGDSPHKFCKVRVHYTGWLQDGTVFDTSVTRGAPAEFALNSVILGWIEGLQTMKVGGKRRLEIPPNLGYGDRAAGKIPANSTLIFEVEMLDILSKPELPPPPTGCEGKEVTTTETGVKYCDLQAGTGETFEASEKFVANYSGWLEKGDLFFSTTIIGKPQVLDGKTMMPGFVDGVKGMKVGGKRFVTVPPERAFGKAGDPRQHIPPDATITFEISLEKVLRQPQQTAIEGIEPIELDGGIKIWEIKAGKGEEPSDNCWVKAQLSMWLPDGKFVHSSYLEAEPPMMEIDSFIKGFGIAARKCKPGGHVRAYIPEDYAFGETGWQGVPSDSPIILEIQMEQVTMSPKQTNVDNIEPVTTATGLKYWDIRAGTGETPSSSSMVKVHYTGWLSSGKVFDSSVVRGDPIEFSLTQVIPGWGEGVGSMKVGGVRRLQIPPELGYGARGAGNIIPPNETLIFEVELISIK